MSHDHPIEHLASNQRVGGSSPSGRALPTREALAADVLRALHSRRDPSTVHAVAGLVAPERSSRVYHTGWSPRDDSGNETVQVAYLREARGPAAIVHVHVAVNERDWEVGQAYVVKIRWDAAGNFVELDECPPVELLDDEAEDVDRIAQSRSDAMRESLR